MNEVTSIYDINMIVMNAKATEELNYGSNAN